MNAPRDGGPAFPLNTPAWHESVNEGGYEDGCCDFTMGMTLRDYFAAKALAGMASQYHANWTTAESAAKHAYELADAMLNARDR